ncbi:hypothetical protein BC937DRAFT_92327 [Endogone sp. FLAS-F59071]|nr:hypothetical protein BC937DRAFT_92327 [Endogone sp. FLAS-F59071]|eukprot:RUS15548.1 hypothetical protein BC937DRAFT_92327 [Endogone sp. FLAS-F59071]
MSNATGTVEFFHILENLKRTKRTGWVDHDVRGPESIADHMHRMGVMAMLIDDRNLSTERCIKMAIVHDLAESVVDAMEYFRALLGDTPQAHEIYNLWQEYEDALTPEAQLVKDLDKFEMIVQAAEYEQCEYGSVFCLIFNRASKLLNVRILPASR